MQRDKRVIHLEPSTLGEVAILKGSMTQEFFARVCSPRRDPQPPLRLVYYKSQEGTGKIVDQVWSGERA